MKVQIEFPNTDRALSSGMYGEVKVGVAQNAPSTIPTSTIIYDTEGTKVAVVVSGDNGSKKIQLKKITLGRDFGTDVEILTGLEGKEQIVANPSQRIIDGGEVHIS